MSVNSWNENIKDIRDAWPIFILMFFVSIVLCIIFYYLVEHFTIFMIFLMIIGSIIGLVILGVTNWLKYKHIVEDNTLKENEGS